MEDDLEKEEYTKVSEDITLPKFKYGKIGFYVENADTNSRAPCVSINMGNFYELVPKVSYKRTQKKLVKSLGGTRTVIDETTTYKSDIDEPFPTRGGSREEFISVIFLRENTNGKLYRHYDKEKNRTYVFLIAWGEEETVDTIISAIRVEGNIGLRNEESLQPSIFRISENTDYTSSGKNGAPIEVGESFLNNQKFTEIIKEIDSRILNGKRGASEKIKSLSNYSYSGQEALVNEATGKFEEILKVFYPNNQDKITKEEVNKIREDKDLSALLKKAQLKISYKNCDDDRYSDYIYLKTYSGKYVKNFPVNLEKGLGDNKKCRS